MKKFNFAFTNNTNNTKINTWTIASNLQDAIYKIAYYGQMPVGEEWRWTGVRISKN